MTGSLFTPLDPSLSFLNIRFPVDVTYGIIGGAEFCTTVNVTASGGEYRNKNILQPRRKYTIDYSLKTPSQISTLVNFFNICEGMAKSFRFKDWCDFEVTNQKIADGNGEERIFQLIKVYSFDGITSKRVITKPIASSVNVHVGNDNLIQGKDYSIDETTGMIEFGTPPQSGIPIVTSFQFDMHARFGQDFLPIKIVDQFTQESKTITILEII